MIGEVIGNYRIEAILGQGGMGVVYRAQHVTLGRAVALKMLLPQLSHEAGIVQRFFNEARASSAIDHPGIVEIYDFGRHHDGRAYIVMALLQGESLEGRLRRGGPLPPLLGASLLAQAASALAAAHARGIVHRDLKPDNLFLVPNEMMPDGLQVKLLDFGIAKLADDQGTYKTQTGALIGTPAYMSPEQCMGASDLDHRTDLYSLGCILFHVLVGRPPFQTTHGSGALIAAHLRDEPVDVRSLDPRIPDALALIVRRLLAKDPAARYQTALDVRAALVEAGAHAPTQPGQAGQTGQGGRASVAPTGPRFTGPDAYGATTAPLASAPVAWAPNASGPGASGPGASGPGAAMPPPPSTNTNAAAQLVPAPGAPRSKVPVVVGVGVLLAAVAGIGVAVALRGRSAEPGSAATTTQPAAGSAQAVTRTDAPAIGSGVSAGSASAGSAPAGDAPAGSDALAGNGASDACPDGQSRTADTAGQCCWRDQAWSSAKRRCVGVPRCPNGMAVRGEACVAEAATGTAATGATPSTNATGATAPTNATGATGATTTATGATTTTTGGTPPATTATIPVRAVTTFTLASATVAPGEVVEVQFPARVASPPADRSWISISPAGGAASAYLVWDYVPNGATAARLVAPRRPGTYEARLYTHYPAQSYNIAHRVTLTVAVPAEAPPPSSDASGARAEQFTVDATTYAPRAKIRIAFPAPLVAKKGERYWITVVPATAAPATYATWDYVAPAARGAVLEAPVQPGAYEVRLHGNYPTKTANVVATVAITVR